MSNSDEARGGIIDQLAMHLENMSISLSRRLTRFFSSSTPNNSAESAEELRINTRDNNLMSRTDVMNLLFPDSSMTYQEIEDRVNRIPQDYRDQMLAALASLDENNESIFNFDSDSDSDLDFESREENSRNLPINIRIGNALLTLANHYLDADNREEDTRNIASNLISYKFNEYLSSENKECSICYLTFLNADENVQAPCKHEFHEICLNEWIKKKNTCPLCRYDLRKPQPTQE